MARVVTEMYRVENVIYVRIKATGDQPANYGSTARLLTYRQKAQRSARLDSDDLALESFDPLEPVRR